MLYTLRFFLSSKCSLFHTANLFGFCIIHILCTGCAKIKKKKIRRQRVKATDTHSEYVICINFRRQQWLRERASILFYT